MDLIYGLIQYAIDRKSSKKCPWLITWLRAHTFTGLEFTCRKKSSFMTVTIYVPFPFVRREKLQRKTSRTGLLGET